MLFQVSQQFPNILAVIIVLKDIAGLVPLCTLGKDLVQGQLESIIQHTRDQVLQDQRRLLNARIRIRLDKPRFHFLVDHEVVPKNLHAPLPMSFVYFFFHA